MCGENCKCNDKKGQMREILEEIVEAFEYCQSVNGSSLKLNSIDIENIKEILK